MSQVFNPIEKLLRCLPRSACRVFESYDREQRENWKENDKKKNSLNLSDVDRKKISFLKGTEA